MNITGPSLRFPSVPQQTVPRPVSAPPCGEGAEPRARSAGEPSLSDLLTPEERAFFETCRALGTLAYGAGGAAADLTGAPLGQRIDVRG